MALQHDHFPPRLPMSRDNSVSGGGHSQHDVFPVQDDQLHLLAKKVMSMIIILFVIRS